MTDDLCSGENQKINVDDIMDRVIEKGRERKISLHDQEDSQINVSSHDKRSDCNPSTIKDYIECAATEFDVGGEVTEMEHFHNKFIRKAAISTGKIILYLARFITAKQRRFNRYTVEGLKLISEEIDQQKTALNQQKVALNCEIIKAVSELNKIVHKQTHIQSRLESIEAQYTDFKGSVEKDLSDTTNHTNCLEYIYKEIKSKLTEADKNINSLKSENITQNRRISLFLEEARKRLPEQFSQDQLNFFVGENKQLLDSLLASLEDQFSGINGDTKERYALYLPLIKKIQDNDPKALVLDLGCGSGEWLALLKQEGCAAQGLELNSILVNQCKNRGLEVHEGDMINELRSLSDNSLSAITAFHSIEHLTFEELINFLDEIFRVLKPGGIVILETPDPKNIHVSTYTFYMNPYHHNPLPSPLMEFIVEARGFTKVEIKNLNPSLSPLKGESSEISHQLSELFYGPQSYAVIGYKV